MELWKAKLESMKQMREQQKSTTSPSPTTSPVLTKSPSTTQLNSVSKNPFLSGNVTPRSNNNNLIPPTSPVITTNTNTNTTITQSHTNNLVNTNTNNNINNNTNTPPVSSPSNGGKTAAETLASLREKNSNISSPSLTSSSTKPNSISSSKYSPVFHSTPNFKNLLPTTPSPSTSQQQTSPNSLNLLSNSNGNGPSDQTVENSQFSSKLISSPQQNTTYKQSPSGTSNELADLKTKYEMEVKKRQDMEKRFQEKVKEVATLKTQLQRSMAPSAARPPPSTALGGGGGTLGGAVPGGAMGMLSPADRKAARASRRISIRPGAIPGGAGPPGRGNRKSIHVANQLTSLVTEIAKIEQAITAAHAARSQAEDRLYDICTEKLTLDAIFAKVLQCQTDTEITLRKVTNDLKRISGTENISALILETRKNLIESIENAVKESGVDHEIPKMDFNLGPSPTPSIIPIPPPSPASERKPPPPPVFKPSPSPSSPATSSAPTSPSMNASLLDQIRFGLSLKQIDLQRLKEERAASQKEKRKSMAQLKSLTDTLREALLTRAGDLMGEEEDDDEDDEDWM